MIKEIQNVADSSILADELDAIVIGRIDFDYSAFGKFLLAQGLSWTHDDAAKEGELLVEASGRICYMSFGENQHRVSTSEYIKNLIRSGHESVLEHASWTFLLTGVSRAFSHQFVRHRVGFSYSQLSQQYHDETEAKFIPPYEIRSDIGALEAWATAMVSARSAYSALVGILLDGRESVVQSFPEREKRRAIRSAARSVLPNCVETKIVFTANARSLRHFLKLRGSIIGDREMREVSAILLKRLKEEAPLLFSDFSIGQIEDGSPIVSHQL